MGAASSCTLTSAIAMKDVASVLRARSSTRVARSAATLVKAKNGVWLDP
jgi:hypothetical protein